MSYEAQIDVTPTPPNTVVLEFDKLNEQGMAKGIPSSMIYQVFTKDGLEGLNKFVEGWKGYEKSECRQYLDQHHQ